MAVGTLETGGSTFMMKEYPRRRDHDGINGTREWATDRVTASYRGYKRDSWL